MNAGRITGSRRTPRDPGSDVSAVFGTHRSGNTGSPPPRHTTDPPHPGFRADRSTTPPEPASQSALRGIGGHPPHPVAARPAATTGSRKGTRPAPDPGRVRKQGSGVARRENRAARERDSIAVPERNRRDTRHRSRPNPQRLQLLHHQLSFQYSQKPPIKNRSFSIHSSPRRSIAQSQQFQGPIPHRGQLGQG